MKKILVIAELVFAWSFSVALVLAAVDWIRPLSVSPFFNVGWLIGIAAVSLVARAVVSGEEDQEERRPPWIIALAVFIFAAVAARSLGWLAAIALGGLATLVVWTIGNDMKPERPRDS